MKTQTFGWQHILIQVPIDWHMIFEKESRKRQKKETGYFGFRDSKEKKLEISYAKIEKKPPDINKVIEDYFKSLKKSHKKIGIKNEGPKKISGHDARYIYWDLEKEGLQGYIVAWNCQSTQRLVICTAQFEKVKKSTEKSGIMEIISLINCHPESTFSIWSAPNLQIHTPYLRMRLKKKNFLIGLTFLHLGNDDLDFLAYRIGLANQKITSDDKIPSWFQKFYKKNLPGIPSNYNPEEFTKLIYKKKTITWKCVQLEERKFSLKFARKYHETYLWSNPDKNDIYCIIYSMKRSPLAKTRDIIEKMTKLAIGGN
ncbi:MAG: hypothetical protein JSV04_12435 [Candidatus Heimdallarchaeota archaeon]|nr:MAG: hypothetical protein JSV04_12435 [Candidatus Heimdallarchaeota archaeon]